VLAPNVYVVTLGRTDFEHLGQWSDQLAEELADMVAEHIDDEGYQVFDKVTVHLERDTDLPTGVFEVSSHVADPAHPPSREDHAVHGAVKVSPVAPPLNGVPPQPPLPPRPPLRGRSATDTGKQGPSYVGRAGSRPGVSHVLVVDGPGTRHELSTGRNVIGRGTEADIRLPDTGVSRKHVDVVLDGGTATVEDLGSTNGTLVNGRRVNRQALVDGDVIRIGHSVLVYRQDGS
jgi:FhaA, N-terminal domain/FHA domain